MTWFLQRGPEAGSANHVGIICGKTDAGDWIVVHCSSSKNGVTVGEAYSASFRYIRQPSFYPNAQQVEEMRQSGKTIANTQYITGIDVSNNLQDLIKANLVTTGDMDTVIHRCFRRRNCFTGKPLCRKQPSGTV